MERLSKSLEQAESAKKAPEMGAVLAEQWGPVVGNISGPMQMRLVEDLWSTRNRETGMVFFAVSGKTLGNFDILSDARANHRMMVRQHVEREGHDDFNVWTDFIPRRFSQAKATRRAQRRLRNSNCPTIASIPKLPAIYR